MKKKISIFLIMFGIIGIIVIVALTKGEEIKDITQSTVAQIKTSLSSLLKNGDSKKQNEEAVLPIKISYSDLSIDQKIRNIENTSGQQLAKASNGGKSTKAEINRKNFDSTDVKINYNIDISNKGNDSGSIEKIVVTIPSNMELSIESSGNWEETDTNTVMYTENDKIEKGTTKTIPLSIEGPASSLTGEQKSEALLISDEDSDQRITEQEENQEIDESNVKEYMEKTNNYSSASAIISISTWLKDYSNYFIIALSILVVIGIITFIARKKTEKKAVTKNVKVYRRVA